MLKNNIYNIDREFDYPTIKDIVIQSLENIAKEEALKKRPTASDDVISNCISNHDVNHVEKFAPTSHLLKLKIRNTTKYLNWRLSILKRDNFTCLICHASVKENKSLRLEVHHPKSFDDTCIKNNVSTIEQALACEEL
jgi:hypothetical protein